MYKSDFTGGTDGWALQVQAGLSASLSRSSGKLVVGINTGGTEAWHLQLTKRPVALQEGKMYRIMVSAAASAERNITVYAGKSTTPWNSYSGYASLPLGTTEQTFTNTFRMSSPTDSQARIVIDLGNSTQDVEIIEVRLEEISTIITSVAQEPGPNILFFPNPVTSFLQLKNAVDFQQALVYDMQGRNLAAFNLPEGEAFLNLENYSRGLYLIRLVGKKQKIHQFKIIKL